MIQWRIYYYNLLNVDFMAQARLCRASGYTHISSTTAIYLVDIAAMHGRTTNKVTTYDRIDDPTKFMHRSRYNVHQHHD